VSIPVGLPAKIDKPVPASQIRFKQFRVIERFCFEGSNKLSDRGHTRDDLELFIGRTFRASTSSFSAKLKLKTLFHFFFAIVGEGGLTSGLV